jgi:4-hydroxy-tetrahydrodipicolinate synthase
VPTIRAIKDWIDNVQHHEWHVRTLQGLPRPGERAVDAQRLAVLLARARLQWPAVGQRQRHPDLQSQLFAAVQRNDLAAARALNDRIEPLMRVFYADPFVDMHNRMKEALVLLGRIRARSCGRRWSRCRRPRSAASAQGWSRPACSAKTCGARRLNDGHPGRLE